MARRGRKGLMTARRLLILVGAILVVVGVVPSLLDRQSEQIIGRITVRSLGFSDDGITNRVLVSVSNQTTRHFGYYGSKDGPLFVVKNLASDGWEYYECNYNGWRGLCKWAPHEEISRAIDLASDEGPFRFSLVVNTVPGSWPRYVLQELGLWETQEIRLGPEYYYASPQRQSETF